jgi:hypothetical protein
MTLENVDDESSYSIDERKFFIQSASMKLLAYIIPKDDIKTELRPKRVKVNPKVALAGKTRVSLDFEGEDDVVLDIKFNDGVSRVTFNNDDDMLLKLEKSENARNPKLKVNDEDYDISSWFMICKNDEVKISITKPRQNLISTLVFKGKLV